MSHAYRWILSVHGLLGAGALITYWIAGLSAKGSTRHRTAGKFFFLLMLGLVCTAAPLAVIIALRGNGPIAAFLAYLVVITGTSMYLGWFAIRRSKNRSAFYGQQHLSVAWLNVVAAITVLAIGWRTSSALLMGFSVAGFALAAQMLFRRYRPMQSPRWWLQEHYIAMMGCGVATHIAFLSIGLNRIASLLGLTPPGWYNLIAWFAPLAIANAVTLALNRKFFSRPRTTLARPLPSA
jgi:hypothetical protein